MIYGCASKLSALYLLLTEMMITAKREYSCLEIDILSDAATLPRPTLAPELRGGRRGSICHWKLRHVHNIYGQRWFMSRTYPPVGKISLTYSYIIWSRNRRGHLYINSFFLCAFTCTRCRDATWMPVKLCIVGKTFKKSGIRHREISADANSRDTHKE